MPQPCHARCGGGERKRSRFSQIRATLGEPRSDLHKYQGSSMSNRFNNTGNAAGFLSPLAQNKQWGIRFCAADMLPVLG